MTEGTYSDALVFFGATGDLAYKKIFPSLQAMIRRGHLDIPVIGVAKAGWNLDQFRARARDSLEKHGGIDEAAFAKMLGLLHYIDGDYGDPATFSALRRTRMALRLERDLEINLAGVALALELLDELQRLRREQQARL